MTRQNEPPNPSGSANEKVEIPLKTWPDMPAYGWEQYLRAEGIEEDMAQRLSRAFANAAGMQALAEHENYRAFEHWANTHTHPGGGEDPDDFELAKVLMVSAAQGGEVRAHAGDTGNTVWTGPTMTEDAFVPSASPDFDVVYVPYADGTLKALDTQDGSEIWSISISGARLFAAAATENAVFVADFNNEKVWARSTVNGNALWDVGPMTDSPRRVAVNPNGDAVYVGLQDNSVVALNPTNGAGLWDSERADANTVVGVAVSVDGSSVFIIDNDGTVERLDAGTGSEVWSEDMSGTSGISVATSRDGTKLYVLHDNGRDLTALSTSDGSEVWTRTIGGWQSVGGVAVSLDDSLVVINGNNGTNAFDATDGSGPVWENSDASGIGTGLTAAVRE